MLLATTWSTLQVPAFEHKQIFELGEVSPLLIGTHIVDGVECKFLEALWELDEGQQIRGAVRQLQHFYLSDILQNVSNGLVFDEVISNKRTALQTQLNHPLPVQMRQVEVHAVGQL